MATVWHYKTTTNVCNTGVTDSSGTASCTKNISGATSGYTVGIDVTLTLNGNPYYASTSFTPQ
jgi:hypothetical protein